MRRTSQDRLMPAIQHPMMIILAVGPADAIAMTRAVNYALEQGLHVVLASDRHPAAATFHPLLTRIDLPVLEPTHGISEALARAVALLREIFNKWKPDIIHVHGLGPYAELCRIARMHPTVTSVWGFLNDLMTVPPAPLPAEVDRLLPECAAILVESRALQKAVASTLPNPKQVEIFNLGIDTNLFVRSQEARTRWRKALCIPSDGYIVISPRGWDPNYNQPIILEGFRLAKKRLGKPMFLVLVRLEREAVAGASANEMLAMEELIANNQLTENVRWLPPLRHIMMSGLLSAADLLVSIPSSDAMPSTLIEAAACELPFIASNIPHYRGTFIQDEGILVDPNSSDAIATAIVRHTKGDYSPDCSSLRNRIIQEFDVTASEKKLISIYSRNRHVQPQQRPQISVIITTYNRPQMLLQALDSALAQTMTDREIIVVDDGSSLDIEQVLSTYEGRIQLIRKENGGLASARNAGLKVARGHFVAFLDDDDLWSPDRLSALFSVISDDETIDVVFGDMRYVNAEGLPIEHRTCFRDRPPPPGPVHPEMLFICNVVPVGAALVRYTAIAEVGFFDEKLKTAEDYDLWLRLSEQKPESFRWIDLVVADYRQHDTNISSIKADQLMLDVIFVREKAFDRSQRIQAMHPSLLERYFFDGYLYTAERALDRGEHVQAHDLIKRFRQRHSETDRSRALAERYFQSSRYLLRMPKRIWPWQFVHVPKTGGTAIEDAAREIGWDCGRFASFYKCEIPCASHWHHPPSLHLEVYLGYKLFSIVRNPYDRIVSDFRYLHKAGAISETLDPTGLNSFVHKYLRHPLPTHISTHLRPQTDLTHGSLPVDRILPFSEFPSCLNFFFDQEGIPAQVVRVVNATAPSVSVDDLTPASRELIADFYARDFALLRF